MQLDIMSGSGPAATAEALYICDECHVHSGGVIHCTGCVKVN